MLDHTVTMNSKTGDMFRTVDGGHTWQSLGSSPSGEFRLVSPTLGWMRATCCTGGAYQLYRTEDGGQTWQVEQVSGSDQDDDYFLPAFFGTQAGILPVILREQGAPEGGITFFRSNNGDQTWEPTGKLTVVSDDLAIGTVVDVQVVNDQTWVVAVGSSLYWTTDGGQHWSQNTDQIARSIWRLALGSATSGWGLQCNERSAPACVSLVQTEDMGAHWERIRIKP